MALSGSDFECGFISGCVATIAIVCILAFVVNGDDSKEKLTVSYKSNEGINRVEGVTRMIEGYLSVESNGWNVVEKKIGTSGAKITATRW